MEKCCIICLKEVANYRCPNCRKRYCSVICCSKHKEICQNEVQNKSTQNDNDNNNNNNTSSVVNNSNNRNEESSQRILSEIEKNKIRNSKKLNDLLSSKRLREELIRIDSSGDSRQIELKKARKNHEFENFVSILLSVIEGEQST